MRKIIIGLSLFYSSFYGVFAQSERFLQSDSVYTGLSDEEVEKVRNMPNIEVGKGITFQPQNDDAFSYAGYGRTVYGRRF